MLIQILNITKTTATSKAGKAYEVLDIAFKNLTFQGKVEGKKLMPFGANANAFNTLKNATGGTYEITVVKNDAGYNDWTNAVPSDGQQTELPSLQTYQPKAAANAPARTNTFETPEERAKKQVYIVRQSSISAAVAALSVGSKVAPKATDVIVYAQELEAFVFGIAPSADNTSGFDDMIDDVPM